MGDEDTTQKFQANNFGMYATEANYEFRERISSPALLTELFHAIMDEFLGEFHEFNLELSFVLIDYNGIIIAQRSLALLDLEQQTKLPSQDPCEELKVEILQEPEMLNYTLLMRTFRRSAESMLTLRSLASAITARVQTERLGRENTWLTGIVTRTNFMLERQNTLSQLSKQLHELNDVNAILKEWFNCLGMLYPQFHKQLYVSQDHLCPGFPVMPLSLYEGNHLCTKAFMEGRIISELDELGTNTYYRSAAIPLKGKQGVYGVLHLLPMEHSISPTDLEFIGLLSDTAGTAFENAQLFGQTVLLVQELQLINEITHRLNQSLNLQDIFHYAFDELKRIFNPDFACILDLELATNELIVRASDSVSMLDKRISTDSSFIGLMLKSKEPILMADYQNAEDLLGFKDANEVRSVLGCPILDNGDPIGAIWIAHRLPNYFSYKNYKLLQVLAVHIGLALTNASLHAEVHRMVTTDHLTGLHTRHYLDEQIAALQKKDACGALVLLDIDNFKLVNDIHGHQIGDDVLIQVSQIIKSCIRDGDIPTRWGGEELAIYLPKVKREQAIHVAERICSKVREETSPKVTVSCGVSDWSCSEAKLSAETLFFRTDMALYKAKNAGKNQIMQG